jgi:hypothetical protein
MTTEITAGSLAGPTAEAAVARVAAVEERAVEAAPRAEGAVAAPAAGAEQPAAAGAVVEVVQRAAEEEAAEEEEAAAAAGVGAEVEEPCRWLPSGSASGLAVATGLARRS